MGRRTLRCGGKTSFSLVVMLALLLRAPNMQARPHYESAFASSTESSNTNSPAVRGGSSPYVPQQYAEENYPGDQQETVQDRVDAWRQQQQAKYSQQSAAQKASTRDEQGRVKLLAHVSRGSRAVIFFVLMWRDVHLYEVADQTFKGLKRLIVVTPLVVLFVANMAGVASSLTSPSHSAKKRLKAILNLDKLVECFIIFHNLLRLTLAPAKYIPRETYIANTIYSVFIILQSQAFTKVTWDDIKENKAMPQTAAYTSYSSGMEANPSYGGMGTNTAATTQQSHPEQEQQWYGSTAAKSVGAPPQQQQSYDR